MQISQQGLRVPKPKLKSKKHHSKKLFSQMAEFILFLQKKFQFLTLDPSVYYVTVAPVYIDWTYVVLLNVMTFVLCLLMLLIPSFVISKISPIKAIKFN